MEDILVIMLARGVGGLERRTATAYQFAATLSTDCRITFLVNRAQLNLFAAYSDRTANNNLHLVTFGLPYRRFILREQSFWYITDYLLLAVKLLTWLPVKHFSLAYFTKFSSLPFRSLVRSKVKILAFVDSHTPERILDSNIFTRILRENFFIDCLSEDLRQKALVHPEADKCKIHTAPCSFTDYSLTGIGKKKQLISFVGRFAQGKGLSILLDALPEILAQHPDLTVSLLGHGPLADRIHQSISENNLQRVTVRFSPAPVQELRNSLIFLSLQEKENYPSQSLLEAMACGNAIIASNVGLTGKLVTPDVGLLIRRTPEALIQAVTQLLATPQLTRRMGIQARKKVLAEHTAENYIQYLQDTFLSSLPAPNSNGQEA